MKSEFKAKLIQHLLSKKNSEKGFTLIELLVVIVIIGILAAIALPSFLSQANKARQSEARTYVGSINRSQQQYFLDQSVFGPDLTSLEVGLTTGGIYYTYVVTTAGAGGTTIEFKALGAAQALKSVVKEYAGTVWVAQLANANAPETYANVCEEVKAGSASVPALAATATNVNNAACAAGFTNIR